MIPTVMILAGMMMMVWPCRPTSNPDAVVAVGNALREAYGDAVAKPSPRDMRRMLYQLDAPPRRVSPRR